MRPTKFHPLRSLFHKRFFIPRRRLNSTAPSVLKEGRISLITIEIALRTPLAALPRLEIPLAVHDIDLLQGQRLGLIQEEVHDDGGRGVGAEEDEAESVADPRVGEGRQKGNHEVAEPVAGGCQGGLLCAGA